MSDEGRRRFLRRSAALRSVETDDEGTLAFRHGVIEWADDERERRGIEPLLTDGEIHWRARAIGPRPGGSPAARPGGWHRGREDGVAGSSPECSVTFANAAGAIVASPLVCADAMTTDGEITELPAQ